MLYWDTVNSLGSVDELTPENIEELFRFVRVMDIGYHNIFRNKTVANLFLEPSTRTRISFEMASKYLGLNVININGTDSSIVKGETREDTIRTLMDMGVDMLVCRDSEPATSSAAQVLGMPVINAGSGIWDHPTQAILDAYTILEHFKKIEGLNIVIVGDIGHSRVAVSDRYLLRNLGANVYTCGPIAGHSGLNVDSIINAIYGLKVDVVMPLRIQTERHSNIIMDENDYIRDFQVNADVMSAAGNPMVMAPGPVNYGVEITYDVANGPQSLIRQQVKNGVLVRKALLYLLMRN
jgi:aspartate carbamoyltransferase catalytic subunit